MSYHAHISALRLEERDVSRERETTPKTAKGKKRKASQVHTELAMLYKQAGAMRSTPSTGSK